MRFSFPFFNSGNEGFPENLRHKENITTQDLLEERLRQKQVKKDPKQFWHEVKIRDNVQKWNYRSEYVKRLGLDKAHGRIWLSFGVIIIVGIGAFVTVKSQVIRGRREQMMERERLRKLITKGEANVSN